MIGCVRSEQLLLDFAKTYEIEASRSGGKTHGEPKILDAVMARLSEQQLLAVIAEADAAVLTAYHAAPREIRAIIDTALAPYRQDAIGSSTA